ncbi:unnamed protein product [Wickerhamomyces anomalus]
MADDIPLDRRPNPPGWVPPRKGTNYNPYDPREQRPPQGYPSEFKTPGKKSVWASVPSDATQYQQMKDTMQKLQYSPRPKSQLYPGQYKVLRRVNNYPRFYQGALFTTRLLALGVGVYAVFFYRWNEGFDNVFSQFYRLRLRAKYILNGELSKQELEDLVPKQRGYSKRPLSFVSESEEGYVRPEPKEIDPKFLMERPDERHLMEAQKILQEREERLMRAIDIAEEQIASGHVEKTASNTPRRKLFGIF